MTILIWNAYSRYSWKNPYTQKVKVLHEKKQANVFWRIFLVFSIYMTDPRFKRFSYQHNAQNWTELCYSFTKCNKFLSLFKEKNSVGTTILIISARYKRSSELFPLEMLKLIYI